MVWSAVFSPDGLRILSREGDLRVRVRDLDGNILVTLPGRKNSAAFSPDGRKIVTSNSSPEEKVAQVWDPNGKPVAPTPGPYASDPPPSLSPDGARILTVSADHTARLWDLEALLQETLP